MKKFMKFGTIALASTLAFALSACAGTENGNTDTDATTNDASFDLSTIKADPEVEKLVPAAVKERDVLRNGASTDYPPLEFLLEDGTTPTGAEVDLVKAIALTMGLKDGVTTTETFDALLPKIGSTYDIGASGFTVTPERLDNYDMLAYLDMGSQFATAKDNPNNFDPSNICGTTIGGQTGTSQITDLLPELSAECEADGKEPIKIMHEDLLNTVIPKVISGQYDAFVADSAVTIDNVNKANGQLEVLDDVFDSAPLAIVVQNSDQELSIAVEAAMNTLIENGTFQKIMDHYGIHGIYSEVEVHSTVR